MSTPILMVGNFVSSKVGHRQYCEDLADRLERRGRAITRASRQHRRLLRLADMLATVWRARRACKLALVDVYAGQAFVWAEATCFELERLGIPYILTLHGGSLPSFARRWPRRVARLFARAARITAPSPYLSEQLRHLAPGIEVLPNALDVACYPRPGPGSSHQLIWLRTFDEIYQPRLAVEVMALLHAELPTLRLRMIGADRGGWLERTRRLVDERGLADVIELAPGVAKADVGAELARGAIFLNTSRIDNTPVTVLEAMAGGLAVVSTDVGGLPYLVSDERNGLLVPSDDPPAMARAVRRLVADRELAGRLGQSARAATRSFDWSVVLERWDRLIEDVADA